MSANSFGPALKSLRESGGLTQDSLAAALNIQTGYVSKLERGERTPSAELVIQVSNLFTARGQRVSLNALLESAGLTVIDHATV